MAAPDLSAALSVVVDQADAGAVICSYRRSRHPRRSRAYHHDVKAGHPVTTSMPCCTMSWQVRTCLMPLTVAQHSMQTPMAQRAFRGVPVTDLRVAMAACINAAATLVSCAIETDLPLIVRSTAGFAGCVEVDRFIGVRSDVDCNPFCILRKKRWTRV